MTLNPADSAIRNHYRERFRRIAEFYRLSGIPSVLVMPGIERLSGEKLMALTEDA